MSKVTRLLVFMIILKANSAAYREEAPGRFLKLQKVYSTYSTRVQIYFYSYSIELSIFLSI